jgi:hypothetical protein
LGLAAERWLALWCAMGLSRRASSSGSCRSSLVCFLAWLPRWCCSPGPDSWVLFPQAADQRVLLQAPGQRSLLRGNDCDENKARQVGIEEALDRYSSSPGSYQTQDEQLSELEKQLHELREEVARNCPPDKEQDGGSTANHVWFVGSQAAESMLSPLRGVLQVVLPVVASLGLLVMIFWFVQTETSARVEVTALSSSPASEGEGLLLASPAARTLHVDQGPPMVSKAAAGRGQQVPGNVTFEQAPEKVFVFESAVPLGAAVSSTSGDWRRSGHLHGLQKVGESVSAGTRDRAGLAAYKDHLRHGHHHEQSGHLNGQQRPAPGGHLQEHELSRSSVGTTATCTSDATSALSGASDLPKKPQRKSPRRLRPEHKPHDTLWRAADKPEISPKPTVVHGDNAPVLNS